MKKRDISILDLDRSMKRLLGSLSWNVRCGLTNLSMEFGKPRVRIIHEPVPNIRLLRAGTNVRKKEIRRHANRRAIAVTGCWTLWIRHAYWRIVRSNVCLATTCSSMRKMTSALWDLEGQRLIRVSINSQTGATRFEFDLDTILDVRRKCSCSEDEIWVMYGADGYERSVRSDGSFKRLR